MLLWEEGTRLEEVRLMVVLLTALKRTLDATPSAAVYLAFLSFIEGLK